MHDELHGRERLIRSAYAHVVVVEYHTDLTAHSLFDREHVFSSGITNQTNERTSEETFDEPWLFELNSMPFNTHTQFMLWLRARVLLMLTTTMVIYSRFHHQGYTPLLGNVPSLAYSTTATPAQDS